MAISGDLKMIAVATTTGEIRVYKVVDRTRVATIPMAPKPVYSIALDEHGTRVAVGSKVGIVSIYGLPAGKIVKSLTPVPIVAAH